MLPPDASENALRSFFRKHSIAEISELFHLLETRSRMSVFWRLKAIGYRSSFNHAGRYYTLVDVPRFDQWGLWFHRNVGFSRTGTLKATVVELVEGSTTGMTPKELLALLKLPLANTLYNTLHELRQGARIRRQALAGYHIYLSADPGRADEQLLKRRQRTSMEMPVSDETLIAVLVEALQNVEVLVSTLGVGIALGGAGCGCDGRTGREDLYPLRAGARKKNGGLTLETVAELRAMIRSVAHRCHQQILCTTDTCDSGGTSRRPDPATAGPWPTGSSKPARRCVYAPQVVVTPPDSWLHAGRDP